MPHKDQNVFSEIYEIGLVRRLKLQGLTQQVGNELKRNSFGKEKKAVE